MSRLLAASAAALLLLLAAGCGSGGKRSAASAPPGTTAAQTPTATAAPPPATTTDAQPVTVELYFLAPDGKLVAASREIPHTTMPGTAALHELMNPPDGATTQVPDGLRLTIDANGRADVGGAALNPAALAQVVYTLTSFPTVKSVNGKTRPDVEDLVPAILVEHPSPGDAVSSGFHVTGNANTFEATFDYALKDAAGKQLAHDFVTATSGSGERGTFDFTVPFTVDAAQDGTLSVFERSAENGAVVHEREIPLRLLP
jgi:Immunoglobulin-like domain of bacterial spore germination/Sporulation and spore germination